MNKLLLPVIAALAITSVYCNKTQNTTPKPDSATTSAPPVNSTPTGTMEPPMSDSTGGATVVNNSTPSSTPTGTMEPPMSDSTHLVTAPEAFPDGFQAPSVVTDVTGKDLEAAQEDEGGSKYIGKPGPVFSWKDVKGAVHSLNEYKGKVVLLNFWATWCPPCRKELPDLVKIREDLKGKGFEILGLSVDKEGEGGGTVRMLLAKFAKKNKLTYPQLLANDKLVKAYGSSPYVPTSFLLDKEGNIADCWIGGREEAEMRESIAKVLR